MSDHTNTTDLEIHNAGSIFLFRPLTDTAKAWLAEHCPPDAEHQYMGSAIVVEHRYVDSIAQQIVADGLTLR